MGLFEVSDSGENVCSSDLVPVVAEEPPGFVAANIGIGSKLDKEGDKMGGPDWLAWCFCDGPSDGMLVCGAAEGERVEPTNTAVGEVEVDDSLVALDEPVHGVGVVVLRR